MLNGDVVVMVLNVRVLSVGSWYCSSVVKVRGVDVCCWDARS